MMFFSGGERVALASLKERKEKKQVAPADNLINNVFSVLSLETAFCFTLFTPSCVSLYICVLHDSEQLRLLHIRKSTIVEASLCPPLSRALLA